MLFQLDSPNGITSKEKNVVEETIQQPARQSLSKKFNLSLVIVYLCSILVTAPAIYFVTKDQVYSQAQKDLVLLVDVVKSIQDYVATDLRPHFMKEKIFYSPSFSGIVATARIAKYLKQRQPQYYIRNASDNPLNTDNRVRGLELALLEQFRNDRTLTSLNEEGEIDGQNYLVSSAPKISKKGCLRCHGDPAQAPVDVTGSYGSETGYGYQSGEVVGVSVVGVPLDDIQALTIERSLIIIGGITILFALLFIVVNSMVRRLILEPISDITEVAKAVSQGDLNREVGFSKRNDEIAELAMAFELMRRSLITAIKRMRRKA
jgi:methyl-accepting chemotaxis protein